MLLNKNIVLADRCHDTHK